MDRMHDAIREYACAIRLDPAFADAHVNMGLALFEVGQPHEALAAYDRAIALSPDDADAHWNKAIAALALGDFQQGWELYEWRWKSFAKRLQRQFPRPLLQPGLDLQGKTLLVHAEQGLGDAIQFVRFVPELRRRGAHVLLEVPRPLVRLFAFSFGRDVEVLVRGAAIPPFDLHCPLLSLPRVLRTTLETIPSAVPYLSVDASLEREWRGRLGPKSRPRVGLAWSGSSAHTNDRRRSLALPMLASLLTLPLEFHVLQTELRPSDAALAQRWGLHIHALEDFAETAALCNQMDWVVAVDTAPAHLAGALRLPTSLLLPFAADYRWLLERQDSPWYPTITLMRQAPGRGWIPVLEQLGDVARSRFALA